MADDQAAISHGPDRDSVIVPTHYLRDADARMLRRYKQWLTAQGFTESIVCPQCWEGREGEPPDVRIRLSPDQVVILCAHALLFGVSPGPALFPEPPDRIVEPVDLEYRDISPVDHVTLIAYRHFLARYQRKEALYCRQCEQWGRASGVRAAVSDAGARFACRHRVLTLQTLRA